MIVKSLFQLSQIHFSLSFLSLSLSLIFSPIPFLSFKTMHHDSPLRPSKTNHAALAHEINGNDWRVLKGCGEGVNPADLSGVTKGPSILQPVCGSCCNSCPHPTVFHGSQNPLGRRKGSGNQKQEKSLISAFPGRLLEAPLTVECCKSVNCCVCHCT